MDVEDEGNVVTILVEGNEESYPLLKDIQDKCNLFIKDLRRNKTKTIEEFRKIIYSIETSSEFNYYFLKFLKENNISYREDGQNWNYNKNLKMLKETLTDEDYKSLEGEKTRQNPLKEIKNILNYYVKIYKEKIKQKKQKRNNKRKNQEIKKDKNKRLQDKRNNKIEIKNQSDKKESGKNKKDKRKNKIEINNSKGINNEIKYSYNALIIKNKLNFQKLNFPLITGIERLRLKYYRDLLLENDITTNCGLMEEYIINMEKDTDIFNDSLNDTKFNPKIFLLILTLTTLFDQANNKNICNFFTKNILDKDYKGKYTHIKLSNGKYQVSTILEKKNINKKDYILSGLDKDIDSYKFLPLSYLLLRNESYEKFIKDGGKGFIHKLGLYNSFISYIKFFIRSNAIKQLLSNNECYKNIEALLMNNNFIDDMLDDTHFKFLPFYGSTNYYGYTNKDLMVCFINSIPEPINKIDITNTKYNIENYYHICLLFSIGVKFVSSLHEFLIHILYGYLHYFSNKKLDSISFKEGVDNNDGGFHFERLLTGISKFDFLNINTIVVLLDGISCQKNLSEFQIDLNSEINIDDIILRNKKKKFKGFLSDFLEKYPINFNYFKDEKNKITVSCRGYNGIGVSMVRNEPDSYGGGKAEK